jgi:hypothetical protein
MTDSVADIVDGDGEPEAEPAAELDDAAGGCVFGAELEPPLPQAAAPAASTQASRIVDGRR